MSVMTVTHTESKMTDSQLTHMFKVARRIESEMTATTRVADLRAMCDERAMIAKFRDVLFAGLMVEWAYQRDLSSLADTWSDEYERLVSTYNAE